MENFENPVAKGSPCVTGGDRPLLQVWASQKRQECPEGLHSGEGLPRPADMASSDPVFGYEPGGL